MKTAQTLVEKAGGLGTLPLSSLQRTQLKAVRRHRRDHTECGPSTLLSPTTTVHSLPLSGPRRHARRWPESPIHTDQKEKPGLREGKVSAGIPTPHGLDALDPGLELQYDVVPPRFLILKD